MLGAVKRTEKVAVGVVEAKLNLIVALGEKVGKIAGFAEENGVGKCSVTVDLTGGIIGLGKKCLSLWVE